MDIEIDSDGLQEESKIKGDGAEDTALLREMAVEAREYVKDFDWCPAVAKVHLAFGVGGVVAVFLVQFEEAIEGGEDALWVIVGDLPSAYVDVESGDDGMAALARYCSMMEDWSFNVLKDLSLEECFPVAAEATHEHAEMLRERIAFIHTEILQTPDDE